MIARFKMKTKKQTNNKTSKTTVTLRIDTSVYDKIVKMSIEEDRSFNKMVEQILIRFFDMLHS